METQIAVACKGLGGLDDDVSEVFGRSPCFALVNIGKGRIRKVKTIKNTAADRSHGAGPLICTRLSKLGVDVVVAGNFGPTVSDILREAEIEYVAVPAGTKVRDAVERYLKKHGSRAERLAQAG